MLRVEYRFQAVQEGELPIYLDFRRVCQTLEKIAGLTKEIVEPTEENADLINSAGLEEVHRALGPLVVLEEECKLGDGAG